MARLSMTGLPVYLHLSKPTELVESPDPLRIEFWTNLGWAKSRARALIALATTGIHGHESHLDTVGRAAKAQMPRYHFCS
jgi:hypothetical protein